jgi:hypothetical protein
MSSIAARKYYLSIDDILLILEDKNIAKDLSEKDTIIKTMVVSDMVEFTVEEREDN